MSNFNPKVHHPIIALCIFFGIGALLSNYGVVEGAAYLFCLFAGISIYKMITAQL